jgi:hypothetical protein
MKLWAVAPVKSGKPPNIVWELQGVFSTPEKAEAACKDYRFCVMQLELDEEYGTETFEDPEDYYPKSNPPAS